MNEGILIFWNYVFIYTLIPDIFNYYERTTRGKNDY